MTSKVYRIFCIKNNGDGTFTDISLASHIGTYVNKGMGLAFADYDGDGFMDVFVSNDTFPNLLLHNNGDGTFTDEATTLGVAYNEMGKTVAGMGAEFSRSGQRRQARHLPYRNVWRFVSAVSESWRSPV